MTGLRGIFFDLDDTLIAYSQAERAAIAAGCRLASKLDPAINERSLAAAILEAYARDYAYGTPGFAELASLSVTEFRATITERALKMFGIDDPALTGTLVTAYDEAERKALYAYPMARETLCHLKPHFRLGVITNGPSAMQRAKLTRLDLGDLLEEIVVDTEFGHPKPDARIFAHAARRIGLSPSELMFVGNSLTADVGGSRGAGWTSVWVREPNMPDEESPAGGIDTPHFVVRSVAEVPSLPPVAAVIAEASEIGHNGGRNVTCGNIEGLENDEIV